MGFLKAGEPLSYEETAKRANRIRLLGTLQLLRCYLSNHGRRDEIRRFGHESEYMLVHMNPRLREAKLMPCAPHLLKNIPVASEPGADRYIFMPEFSSYMIEGTPGDAWRLDGDYVIELIDWFRGARHHMRVALERMGLGRVFPFTLTSFPLLGTPNSVCEYPMHPLVQEPVMRSEFCGDILVNPHPRFTTLARNIRMRRGKKVHIYSPPLKVPIGATGECGSTRNPGHARAANSQRAPSEANAAAPTQAAASAFPAPSAEPQTVPVAASDGSCDILGEAEASLSPLFLSQTSDLGNPALCDEIDRLVAANDVRQIVRCEPTQFPRKHIYMDAMVFGMGMCCLQATFSCVDELEARYLYDQLAILAPLFLAMTAATAVFKGTLSFHTTRWRVLSQSVDDRRDEEKELVPFSRFSTVALYISREPYLLAHYKRLNDVSVQSRPEVYEACVGAGLDRIIARHFAAIMARDPLVAYEEDLDEVDIHATDAHFEAFQSTNWNTVRFKPPPIREGAYPIPWRVEFRCCEAQLRDSESASVISAIALLVRVMLKERWNLYVPMSLVHDNMETSDALDAVTNYKFHFVSDLVGGGTVGRYTLYEIFFSAEPLGLFRRCMNHLDADLSAGRLSQRSYDVHIEHLNLLKNRLYGSRPTNSQEIRSYVLCHSDFRGEGVVTPQIVYDLLSSFL
ncbi:glutamate-cysteine ligase [Babesia caballi]|uniref:Glutamate--cysteine ligase n=1 Tax=Babesia caballi TaxID=5871 RepID=A0AAV4LVC0_BABCB|nr:glutamate-cysteine ligase [Babesia caballi]